MKTWLKLACGAVAVLVGVGCEGPPHLKITEESLFPLTEIEIGDPAGHALDQLEWLYRARDAGTDAGVRLGGEKDDGISFFIRRLSWAVSDENGELTFHETINRVVELIVGRTGRPAKGVRTDVEDTFARELETFEKVRKMAADDEEEEEES